MMQSLDQNALLFIQEHWRNDFFTPVFRFFTYLGNGGLVWIVLGVALLLFSSTRRQGAVFLSVLGTAAALNNLLIKNLIDRPRPYTVIPDLDVLVSKLSSSSFPSGHASSSFAAAMALTLMFGSRGAWTFVPATIIALSRSYLGMHYPTDVICGAAIGAVWAWGMVSFFREKTNLLK